MGPIRFANVSFGKRTEADAVINNLRGYLGLHVSMSKSKQEREERKKFQMEIDEKQQVVKKV